MPPLKKHNKKYDIADKRRAVALLLEFGGLTYEGITACEKAFPGLPRSTMGAWYKDLRDEVRPRAIEVVEEKPEVAKAKQDTATLMRNAYINLLDQLQDPKFIRENKNLLHTATAFGIIEERMRLQIGLTNTMIDLTKRFIAVLSRKGFDPEQVYHDLIDSYGEEPDMTLPIDMPPDKPNP
jgi:hypothetical protein